MQAVACLQQTVVGGRSRFDRLVGAEYDLLSDSEIWGLDLFRRKARCLNCHHGPLFSDGRFHDVDLSYYGRETEDLGRYRVTGKPEDVGRFRMPSLRDVTKTEPFDAQRPARPASVKATDGPDLPLERLRLRPANEARCQQS